jgi:hypothetical protein
MQDAGMTSPQFPAIRALVGLAAFGLHFRHDITIKGRAGVGALNPMQALFCAGGFALPLMQVLRAPAALGTLIIIASGLTLLARSAAPHSSTKPQPDAT